MNETAISRALLSFKVNGASVRIEELEKELRFYKDLVAKALGTLKNEIVLSPFSKAELDKILEQLNQ